MENPFILTKGFGSNLIIVKGFGGIVTPPEPEIPIPIPSVSYAGGYSEKENYVAAKLKGLTLYLLLKNTKTETQIYDEAESLLFILSSIFPNEKIIKPDSEDDIIALLNILNNVKDYKGIIDSEEEVLSLLFGVNNALILEEQKKNEEEEFCNLLFSLLEKK